MEKLHKEENRYPIRTVDRTRRQVEIGGKTVWVTETYTLDYGPKQGTTVGYILENIGTAAEAEANRRNLDRTLLSLGYRLKS